MTTSRKRRRRSDRWLIVRTLLAIGLILAVVIFTALMAMR